MAKKEPSASQLEILLYMDADYQLFVDEDGDGRWYLARKAVVSVAYRVNRATVAALFEKKLIKYSKCTATCSLTALARRILKRPTPKTT